MKKYKITTAKKAVQKGLLKEGDEVWVKFKVCEIHDSDTTEHPLHISGYGFGNWIHDSFSIRIPIPEPKPIDFSVAGRVLKMKDYDTIVMTTGHQKDYEAFSAYFLKCNIKEIGETSNDFLANNDYWQDITDTYKPE